MPVKISLVYYGKILGWGLVAGVINLMILFPFSALGLPLDFEGLAFAQTGLPDDTPTPIPTATPTYTPTLAEAPALQDQTITPITNDQDNYPTATFTPLPEIMSSSSIIQTDNSVAPSTVTPVPAEPESVSTLETPSPLSEVGIFQPILVTNNPPPGIPPLINIGDIYQIPPDAKGANFQLPLTALASSAYKITLSVSSAENLVKVVRAEEVELTVTPPVPLPQGIEPLFFFNVDVYLMSSALGITELKLHSPPLVLSIVALNVSDGDKLVLFRYDEITQQYELLPQKYDPATQTLRVFLPKTSFFVLGREIGQVTGLASVAPLSTAPEVATPQNFLSRLTMRPTWLLAATLTGFIGSAAIFLWLGGGSFISAMFYDAPSSSVATHHGQAGGVAFTFALLPSQQDRIIRVSLPLLPPVSFLELSPPRQPTPIELSLLSVEVQASLRPHKPELLEGYAVTLPDHVKLVGWDEPRLQPHQFPQAVSIGHLTWHSQDETFARLLELQTDDTILISKGGQPHYQYSVDKLQHYQATTTAVAKIPQTGPEAQLIFIAWSEMYDIDQQMYRDYLVIQAHLTGDLVKGHSEVTNLPSPAKYLR